MPKTLFWFRCYCGMLSLLYGLVILGGIALFFVPTEEMGFSNTQAYLIGGLFIAMGVFFFLITLLGYYLPQRPGGWTCGLIIIWIGLASFLLTPLGIPLFLAWRKPELQAWFGRNVS